MVVDAKDVGLERLRVVVERGARDDEDGRVDKERKGEERGAELDDGVLEAVLDGGLGGDVEDLLLASLAGRAVGHDGLVGDEALLGVVLLQSRLDDARPEEQAVRHDGGAEDAAGLVQGRRLDELLGGEVPAEDVPDARFLDEGELDAEAHDDADDEGADKQLKQAQALHRAVRAVKDEDEHDVDDGERDARDERQLGDEQVERDGGANDFRQVRRDDGHLGEAVEQVVEPARAKGAARRRQVVAGDGAELDGQALEQDGEEVAEKHDEEQAVLVRGARGDVGRVVARVDIGDRDHEARAHKLAVVDEALLDLVQPRPDVPVADGAQARGRGGDGVAAGERRARRLGLEGHDAGAALGGRRGRHRRGG
ncbi:hypothetical protein NLG97_g7037 [Lecanicillium saksenae]|uniref:Uncharacterized protein n=1 Tax=Lecanicillium saksenae TaxID=468837 RepID=A0ACC1QR50_9HYPO|nr:hypothetical protein NLG97_g7037 [Lecanicillium saksenae]